MPASVWSPDLLAVPVYPDLQLTTTPGGASKIGFYDPVALSPPVYLKTVSDILNGLPISIFRFIPTSKLAGIRAQTNIDDLISYFQAAMVCGAKKIVVPYGKYNVSDTITISQDGFKFIGDGPRASILNSTVTNKTLIFVATGLTSTEIAGFTLDRSAIPVAGVIGLDHSQIGSVGHIHDILAINQYVGVALGSTDFSKVERVTAQDNYSHGFQVKNNASYGAIQWSLIGCLSQTNNGHGYYVQTVIGPPGVSIGTWSNVASFSNAGFGAFFGGLAGCPLNAVRLTGDCFFGSDGNSEIFFDTYAGLHKIDAAFCELPGVSATGRGFATPISHTGCGIEITTNNTSIDICSAHINGASFDGILTAATEVTNLQAVTTTNNGLAGTASRKNGVLAVAGHGRLNCVGVRSNGQEFGISYFDGSKVNIVGSDLAANTGAPITGSTNTAQVQQVGNIPATLNTILPNTSMAVGQPTSGASIVGGINVAGGLAKNNVGYINP